MEDQHGIRESLTLETLVQPCREPLKTDLRAQVDIRSWNRPSFDPVFCRYPSPPR